MIHLHLNQSQIDWLYFCARDQYNEVIHNGGADDPELKAVVDALAEVATVEDTPDLVALGSTVKLNGSHPYNRTFPEYALTYGTVLAIKWPRYPGDILQYEVKFGETIWGGTFYLTRNQFTFVSGPDQDFKPRQVPPDRLQFLYTQVQINPSGDRGPHSVLSQYGPIIGTVVGVDVELDGNVMFSVSFGTDMLRISEDDLIFLEGSVRDR